MTVELSGGPAHGRSVTVLDGCRLINVPVMDEQDEWVAQYDASTGAWLGDTNKTDRSIGEAERWADLISWLWRDYEPPHLDR